MGGVVSSRLGTAGGQHLLVRRGHGVWAARGVIS